MTAPLVKLLVLKTPQGDWMRVFYQTLGIELTEEKHGKDLSTPPESWATPCWRSTRGRQARPMRPHGWASAWQASPRSLRRFAWANQRRRLGTATGGSGR